MKKLFYFCAFVGVFAFGISSCTPKNQPDNPTDQTDTIPTDTIPVDTIPVDTVPVFEPEFFPKKNLIEEFTGQTCGYCPSGMDAIHDFMQGEEDKWVLILHHFGYEADHFTAVGSKSVTTALGVSGAPSCAINRALTKYNGNSRAIVFHPGYLPNTNKTQFDSLTYASVVITRSYNADTRELNINVSGKIGCEEIPSPLKLTVLVKESGMIDFQYDYYTTGNYWSQFRHTNAIRKFVSTAKGDEIIVDPETRTYSEDFTTTLKDAWVADNCMIVAFLGEDFKPIVQAEQIPVVEGTTGGADILHGGIQH